jgi:hypothetical protein
MLAKAECHTITIINFSLMINRFINQAASDRMHVND